MMSRSVLGWNYEIRGEGPLVVLLHPLGADAAFWDPMLARIQGNWCFAHVNLPGHGAVEDCRDAAVDLDLAVDLDPAAAFRALLDVADARSAHLVGLSLGGQIAMRLALSCPDRIASMTLIATNAEAESESTRASLVEFAEHVRTNGVDGWLIDVLVSSFFSEEARSSLGASYYRERLRAIAPEGFAAGLKAVATRDRVAEALGRTAVPVLAVAGEFDEQSPPSRMADSIAAFCRSSRLEVIPGVGHMVALEAPEAVAQLVEGFWAEVEGQYKRRSSKGRHPCPTLTEQIVSDRISRPVTTGDEVELPVDLVYAQDRTSVGLARRHAAEGLGPFPHPQRVACFIDHCSPAATINVATHHKEIRAFTTSTGARLYDVGSGISHQVVTEELARPGQVILSIDSHGSQLGGIGALGLSTTIDEALAGAYLGFVPFVVPPAVAVWLTGRLRPYVTAKDVALSIAADLGLCGGEVLEWLGPGVAGLVPSERLVLANISSDLGAMTGIVDQRGTKKLSTEAYERVVSIDLDTVEPMVAPPPNVLTAVPLRECAGTKIDQVFVGSCTNGRLPDISLVAALLAGKRVAPSVRLLVTPASRRVYEELVSSGLGDLITAGAIITSPGCGACMGLHSGVLADGEACLSTQAENRPGRMGSRDAPVYLASPVVAAATAVRGALAMPQEVFDFDGLD